MNSTDFEKYLKDRFTSQLHWYEAQSEYLKNTYKIVTIATYLFCSVLPILIYFFAHSKLIPITVSLLIILAVSLFLGTWRVIISDFLNISSKSISST